MSEQNVASKPGMKAGLATLNAVVLVGVLTTFLPYIFTPYPCRQISISLAVQPTDQYGRLEYCAFGTHWERTNRVLETLDKPLCGQVKAEVTAKAKALEAKMLADNQKCESNLPGPFDYWRDWLTRMATWYEGGR